MCLGCGHCRRKFYLYLYSIMYWNLINTFFLQETEKHLPKNKNDVQDRNVSV